MDKRGKRRNHEEEEKLIILSYLISLTSKNRHIKCFSYFLYSKFYAVFNEWWKKKKAIGIYCSVI